MKNRIKSIQVETREWSNGEFSPMVTFFRWGDVNETLTTNNSRQSYFYHPTRASVFRAIQAMEAMTKRAAHVQRETSEATI